MASTKPTRQILLIRVLTISDTDADTSFLGTYTSQPTGEDTITRENVSSREHQYFVPGNDYAGEPEDKRREYQRADFERMESLNRGVWEFLGIRAEAIVTLADGVTQTISSAGLWGIESDSSKDYLAEIRRDEIDNLRTQLHAVGFGTRAINAALKKADL